MENSPSNDPLKEQALRRFADLVTGVGVKWMPFPVSTHPWSPKYRASFVNPSSEAVTTCCSRSTSNVIRSSSPWPSHQYALLVDPSSGSRPLTKTAEQRTFV